jgi:Coenzyme PQQ synthesis protein D (PqqD)
VTEFRPGPETRLRPRGDVLFRDLGGEAVLLDPEAGTYFGLNEVGTDIWGLLAGGTSLGEAHAKLVRMYDAPADQVWEDLVALVRDLVGSRLVEVLGD